MDHKNPLFIKLFFLLGIVSFLGGCSSTNNLKPISKEYATVPPQKGLVAFRVGYKTIHQENKFLDVPITLSFNGADEEKKESFFLNFNIHSSKFEQTLQSNYKKGDYLIELVAGEYSVKPATVLGSTIIKPQPSVFNVKAGEVTYIGQYDIEATVKGEGFLSTSIRKKTSHTRDQQSENMEEILAQFPNLKYAGILKQPSPEGKYRMKRFVPAQQTIYIYTPRYKK